ncbi:MAG: Transcriptional regulator, PadR family, partial [uncultured Corynebacteriales bacterium]
AAGGHHAGDAGADPAQGPGRRRRRPGLDAGAGRAGLPGRGGDPLAGPLRGPGGPGPAAGTRTDRGRDRGRRARGGGPM